LTPTYSYLERTSIVFTAGERICPSSLTVNHTQGATKHEDRSFSQNANPNFCPAH
jgi:hypothetical protein